jgi:hypothetical protein
MRETRGRLIRSKHREHLEGQPETDLKHHQPKTEGQREKHPITARDACPEALEWIHNGVSSGGRTLHCKVTAHRGAYQRRQDESTKPSDADLDDEKSAMAV